MLLYVNENDKVNYNFIDEKENIVGIFSKFIAGVHETTGVETFDGIKNNYTGKVINADYIRSISDLRWAKSISFYDNKGYVVKINDSYIEFLDNSDDEVNLFYNDKFLENIDLFDALCLIKNNAINKL